MAFRPKNANKPKSGTRIADLYGIEKQIRGAPRDKAQVRHGNPKPLFAELQVWLDQTLPSLPGRSDLAKAMRYAIARMKRLTVYLDDERLEIHNNAAEPAIRGIAVGRKNHLFAASGAGGERAAVLYTLIETAKLSGIDSQTWLADVIATIADHSIKKSAISCLGSGIKGPAALVWRHEPEIRCPS